MSCRDGFCPPPALVSAASPGRPLPAPKRRDPWDRRELDPRPRGQERNRAILDRIDKTLAEHGAGPREEQA